MPGKPPPCPTQPSPLSSRVSKNPNAYLDPYLNLSGEQQLRGCSIEKLVARERVGERARSPTVE